MDQFVYNGNSKKLSKVLCQYLPDLSYEYIRKLIRKGDVKINGKRTKEDVSVESGSDIIAYTKETEFVPKLIYESPEIYVFYKYQGISSEKFAEKINTVYPEAILCHRLDTNTCGLIIFAKTTEIFESVKEMFRLHMLEKHYYAEVFGDFPAVATYYDFLEKDEKNGFVKIFSDPAPGRMRVETICSLLYKKGNVSCLDVEPVTGKTHQIRAHLAYHGFPLVGDGKYGSEEKNRLLHTHVQHLCAYKLVFHTSSIAPLSSLNGVTVTIDPPRF